MKKFVFAFLAFVLAAFSVVARAETAIPTTDKPCSSVNQNITAVDYAKLSLANDNFKINDLVFINSSNTSAVQAAQAKFNKAGLTWVTLCSGSVTIFVNHPAYSWDQIEAIYNKLDGYLYLHAGATTIRPISKEDLL